MRLLTKSGFAMATILAAIFGFAGLVKAALLAGLTAAVPAVQVTQEASAAEALPEKAFIRHRPWMRYNRHSRPSHHPKGARQG